MGSGRGTRAAVLLVLLLLAVGYYAWLAKQPTVRQAITQEGGVVSLAGLGCPAENSGQLTVVTATYGPETPADGGDPPCPPLDVSDTVRGLVSKGEDFNAVASVLLTPAQLADATAAGCPSNATRNRLVMSYTCG